MHFTGSITLTKGTLTGHLEQTLREHHRGKTYTWVPCLALLDSYGQWLYTEPFRCNGQKNAVKTLESLGWTKQEL